MFNVSSVRTFLAQVALEELASFIIILILLALITSAIRRFASFITRTFPTKRMIILNWVPLFNFIFYLIGFLGAVYIVFQPTEKVYLGFIAGILIAFGFAAKDILQSLIAGIILLIDKPFQVGDRVTFQNNYGEIISIGLRSVKLLTLDEDVVTIPNQQFMNNVVSSSSAGELAMMVTVDIHVPPQSDLIQVKNILENLAAKNSYIDSQKPIAVVAHELLNITGVLSIVMKLKCIIKDARTEKSFQTNFIIDVNQELKNQNIR